MDVGRGGRWGGGRGERGGVERDRGGVIRVITWVAEWHGKEGGGIEDGNQEPIDTASFLPSAT